MATSASKRKQDDKHLKMLREIVALSHNKQCLDCHQRGPTYVNMTVGSFVCTSCSGILRGLNPPHRVKSISMATFTTDEMEFLKNRGNELCRKVWLCRFNPSVHREPDSKDEHKVKEFMSDKYEKKRYYTEGTEALHEEARQMNTPPAKPDPKQLRSMAGNHLPILRVDQSKPATLPQPISQPVVQPVAQPVSQPVSQPATLAATLPAPTTQPVVNKPVSFDLLADLGADPFTDKKPAPVSTTTATTGFADFSNFSGAGITSPPQTTPTYPTGAGLLQPQNTQQPGGSSVSVAPSSTSNPPIPALSGSDKYAALASLDTVFGGGGSGSTVNWDGGWNSSNPSNAFGGSSVPVGVNSTAGFGASTNITTPNPFGGSPSQFGTPPQTQATTPGANPFMGGGFNQQQQQQQQQQPAAFSQYPQPAASSAGFAQFPQSSVPANTSGFGVQNGGFGTNVAPSQAGFGMPGFGVAQGQYGAPSNMMAGGGAQFGAKMAPVAPPAGNQQQQFASWGQPTTGAAVGNPFMAQSTQQPVPPRGSSTNPFL